MNISGTIRPVTLTGSAAFWGPVGRWTTFLVGWSIQVVLPSAWVRMKVISGLPMPAPREPSTRMFQPLGLAAARPMVTSPFISGMTERMPVLIREVEKESDWAFLKASAICCSFSLAAGSTWPRARPEKQATAAAMRAGR